MLAFNKKFHRKSLILFVITSSHKYRRKHGYTREQHSTSSEVYSGLDNGYVAEKNFDMDLSMLKHVDFTHCSAFTQTFENRVTLTSTVTQLAPSMQPAAVFCGFAPLSHNKTKSIKAVSQKWQLRKSAPSSFSLLFALPMKSWN